MKKIYKYLRNGDVIYIGKTNCMERRDREHDRSDEYSFMKGDICYYCDIDDSYIDFVETYLITKYNPVYNTTLKGLVDIFYQRQSLVDPFKWIRFEQPKVQKAKDSLKAELEDLIRKIDKTDFLSSQSEALIFCNADFRGKLDILEKSISSRRSSYHYGTLDSGIEITSMQQLVDLINGKRLISGYI